nr:hypothetical protein [Tanacetum cinerariifolium]
MVSKNLKEKWFFKAIHEEKGAIDTHISSNKGSVWLDLVRDVFSLKQKGIDLLAAIKRKLGNGENTFFWNDKWIRESTLKTKYPILFALGHCKSISVVGKIGHPSLVHSFRRLPRGGAEDEQYRDLCTLTSGVFLPNMHDRCYWSLNANGDFSVSSLRNLIDDVHLPKSDTPTRWIRFVPIKLNITAWKICLDRLPTMFNLSSRGLDSLSIIFPLCNISAESTSHVFFFCHVASQVTIKVCKWWELKYKLLNSYA